MNNAEREGTAIVFDLGGVLIDWNPRYLYRQLFDDEAAMENFLAEVCDGAWNLQQDAGRPFADAVAERVALFPEHRALIEAYWRRWPEMIAGALDDTVALLRDLRAAGRELHALTNWSAETFPTARERFDFLAWFQTILVSGEVKLVKPDARIFELLLERIGRAPQQCVFIDDSPINIAGAAALGLDTIHFTGAEPLRLELERRALLQQRSF